MLQTWSTQTFLHWSYDPEIVRRLLPRGLEPDVFDGMAWISLTPFLLANLRPPGVRPLPWISTSPETNVRTYVRGADGERAIWFFSLDIARLPAALGGRAAYLLPYMWARMTLEDDGKRVRYAGRRRWPRRGASYDITVEPGTPYRDDELTELDHFLTARFVLYTFYGRFAAKASSEHAPWPLARARLTNLEVTLLVGAGLPKAEAEPLIHFSTGVDVRISRPYRAFIAGKTLGSPTD